MKSSAYKLTSLMNWGYMDMKKLKRAADMQDLLGTATLAWQEVKKVELYRQMAVSPIRYVDSQRLVLMLGRERMSAEMSLVWLPIQKPCRNQSPWSTCGLG